MISEAELRRLAGTWGADPMIVDLDYVLGCFLASLYAQPKAGMLRFKGGTCLRKCYFGDYRFSEDLDFTALQRIGPEKLERLMQMALADARDRWQIDFDVSPIRVEQVQDEYGKESYQVRIYYRGPLRRGGAARAIRIDVNSDELLAFPGINQGIIHPYSDAPELQGVSIPCYDLREMMAEKVRAIAGQRQYTISRDMYDITQVLRRHQVNVAELAAVLPAKMETKGLEAGHVDVSQWERRKPEFAADWERHLTHLLAPQLETGFEQTWLAVRTLLVQLNELNIPR